MKTFTRDAISAVVVSVAIIGGYVLFDYLKETSSPKMADSSNSTRYDMSSLKLRNFVIFEGKERNERDYERVLVLDLKGDGIKVRGTDNTYFDYNNDGFGEAVPSLGQDDALLYIHKAEEGRLSGKNIISPRFAENTLGLEASSFDILRAYNEGKDKIDKTDAIANQIKLLSNSSSNMAKEILIPSSQINASELGKKIKASISLDVKPYRKVDNRGNILGDYVEVELENGLKSKIQEVWLYTDTMKQGYKNPINISPELKNFRNIKGAGSLYSLLETMEKDKSRKLKDLVVKFMNEPNYFQRKALLLQIIYHWAEVENADVKGRLSEDGKNYIGDARKIMFLEKYTGKPFRGTHTGSEETVSPHHVSAPIVLNSFNKFEEVSGTILLLDGLLKKYIEVIDLTWNKDNKKWNAEIDKVFPEIEKFYNQYGELQTKLLLNDLYLVIKYLNGNFDDNYNVVNKFIQSGKRISTIDMKNFDHLIMSGDATAEMITGDDENNVIFGKDGNDTLIGRLGDDVYIFGLNDGDDLVIENGGSDTIAFVADINFGNISFFEDKLDLIIKVNTGENGTIRIVNYFHDENAKVETLLFANGISVNIEDKLSDLYKKTDEALSN